MNQLSLNLPTISFSVDGEPKAQPRPRAFARKMGGKFVARVYDAGTAEGWKSAIAAAALPHRPATPLDGPLALTVAFRMTRPMSHYGTGKNAGKLKGVAPAFHLGKPDLDNMVKAVKDALTQIGIWRDDSCVVRETVTKEWAARGGADINIVAVNGTLVDPDPWACSRCGRYMATVSGTATHEGKPWCGCVPPYTVSYGSDARDRTGKP